MGGDPLLDLVRDMTADAGLLEATVGVARSRSEVVAALPTEETRKHTRALMAGVLEALAAGGEPGPGALAAAESLGSDRARQGVPVADFLDGFQAGRTHLVHAIIDRGRERGVPADLLLTGVTRVDAITTVLIQRMVHAHRVAELETARTSRESHLQMLRQLLHGEPVPVTEPLDPAVAYHCVVSDVGDPAVAADLEEALTAQGAGLAGLVDGRLAGLVTRLPDLPADGPLLVAAPPVRPALVADSYALVRRALRAGGAAGLAGLRRLTDLALFTVTEAEPDLGRLLSAELLTGLVPGDAFHRELAETALAYLDHGGRIESTAAALHVHGNTVKYRLRRLQDLTGRSLTDPGGGPAVPYTAHWWWALRRWLAG